jgi:hypothetical protein
VIFVIAAVAGAGRRTGLVTATILGGGIQRRTASRDFHKSSG